MYLADMVMTDRRDTADPRFDRWLSRRLHEAYDGVLKEQLPADLDRLVQQIDAQRSESRRGHATSGGGNGESDDGPVSGRSSAYRNHVSLDFCH